MEKTENQNPIVRADGIDFNVKEGSRDIPTIARHALIRNSDEFYTFEVACTVPYTDAADANYYPIFYVAETQCFLLEAKMRHAVAGGASAEVNVIKVPSGTAKSAGQSMLISAFDLTAAANTV